MKMTLDNYEVLAAPQSKRLEWDIVELDPDEQRLTIKYRWLDDSDVPIKLNEYGYEYLTYDGADFTAIFGFTIRAQDVGEKIGVGLRTLIVNKIADDLFTAGNNYTFDSN